MQTLELESTTLYFREGSSDKVYQCSIEAAGERFVVNFAYGRRGSTLNLGTKTNVPVDYEDAKRIFDKLVKEKKGKGYTEGETGTPYTGQTDKQPSGLIPQLLNPIEESQVLDLMNDDAWCAQEKYDGRRLLVRKEGPAINGINKKGHLVGLSEPLFQVIHQYGQDVVLDGESIGDNFYAFDLLVLDGVDIRNWPYRERLAALLNLLAAIQQRVIKFVDTAFTSAQKLEMLDKLKKGKREGIVFKELHAPYTPGRPNSGGSQLKHKFVATLSAVVSKVNKKRSVELQLLGESGWQTCGNVTIPANHKIPRAGDVVEIRYLYAFKESGVLFQPVYLSVREDVAEEECVAGPAQIQGRGPGISKVLPIGNSLNPPPVMPSGVTGGFISTPNQRNPMKPIILPVAELKQALPGLSKVVGRKTTLPVLSAVKLARTKEGQITIAATDLDTYVTYQAENNQPGTAFEAVVPLEPLSRLIKGSTGDLVICPDDKELKVCYRISGSFVEQRFNTIPLKEWPPEPKITKPAVKMPATFGETLRQAFETSSEDSSRYVLQGAYLDVSDPKCHTIVSTNSRALFAANTFRFDLKESVNISRQKFLAWSGFLEGECEMSVLPSKSAGGWVQLTTPRWTCIVKQIEGNFPNWRQVVPQDTETWTRIELSEPAIAQMLNLASKLPGSDTENHTIQLRVGKELHLEGKNKDDKEFTSALIAGVNIKGKPITTALNRGYLQNALRCGLNQIRIDDEQTPLVFSSPGKKMVVMPVRLSGPSTDPKPAPIQQPAPQAKPGAQTTERTDMPRTAKTPGTTTATSAAEIQSSNGHGSATKSLVDQVELIKDGVKNVVRDLNSLIDAVKQAEKGQRASEKEVESARATLKKLQQVTI